MLTRRFHITSSRLCPIKHHRIRDMLCHQGPNIVPQQPPGKQLLWVSNQVTHSHINITVSQPSHTCRPQSHRNNPVHAGRPHADPFGEGVGSGRDGMGRQSTPERVHD